MGETMGKTGLTVLAFFFLIHGVSKPIIAKSQSDKDGDKKLAEKLLKLSQSLDMKESKYPDSKGGGKDFNANDGNSFTSNTTYHSRVWSVCENWLGPTQCQRWIDPYVSEHGKEGDRSPLEGAVWDEYQGNRGGQGQGGQYAIWQVASKGGRIVDIDGRLDREQLARFKLLPRVTQKVQQVGRDTATRQINLSMDQEDKDANTMPNMESLRMMASRWTKMFRNRLVANIGELRANDRPIEFGLSEEAADCDQYLAQMRQEMDRFRLEQRLDKQGRQQIETRQLALERRYTLCQEMRSKSVYAVNPTVIGNEVLETGPQNEQIDKWRSRVNIALIDYVGIDAESVPKPGDQQIEDDEVRQEMSEFGPGGMEGGTKRVTNAEQLAGYNQALEEAARGMQEVAARSPQIRDTSADILKYKIARGTRNMVELNSLTNEMRTTLEDTGMPRVNDGDRGPETNLELRPTELTVTKR